MTQRLFLGVLLAGLVGSAQAQTTGPLAVEERSLSSGSSSSANAVSNDGVMLLMQQLQMQEEEVAALRGCLLYTSPSPRDRTRSSMPSSA